MAHNILSYSEYRKEQALWLQRTDSERTNKGTNSEQYFLKCYLGYLFICNYKEMEIIERIRLEVLYKMNNYGFGGCGNENDFDPTVYENSVSIVEEIMSEKN